MLERALKTLGPSLSTDLTEYLVGQHGLSRVAARQRVSRAGPKIKKLGHLPFARKARFLYLAEDFASTKYWESLYAAIQATGGPYARALASVEARGAVPIYHFIGACGAPVAQKKQLFAATVLDRLVKANVLVKVVFPGLGLCVMTKDKYEQHQVYAGDLATVVRSRLIAESILLDSIKEWMRRLAMVSFNAVLTRRGTDIELPRVGPFAWDLTGPSYLAALQTKTKGGTIRPGLMVCDVLLNQEARLSAVEPFLHKVRSIQALKNMGRTMFVLVAQHFDADAFKALRTAGVLPATPETLFGKEVGEAFRELVGTLNKAAQGVVDPEKFDELFSKLGKLEGATGNMRGAFFELLVAEVVRKTAPGEVVLNKIIKGEDGEAEIDVSQIKQGIIAQFIECKGVSPGATLDDDDIGLWLTTRIKRARDYLQAQGWSSDKLPRFELWTSGRLSQDARARVEKTRAANVRKFELHVFEGDALRQAVKAVDDTPLLRTFEQHFLPHALAEHSFEMDPLRTIKRVRR